MEIPRATGNRSFISATRITAATLAGFISSLAGVMHGCFEILQGNSTPDGLVINAIGPAQRLWPSAALHAFTLVPNYAATGILAVIIGTVSVIWAAGFIDRKDGPRVMALLSLALFLFGGGFGPLFVGMFASLIATRIGNPPAWLRTRFSLRLRKFLAGLFPGMLVFYVILFVAAVETTVFGYPMLWLLSAQTTELIVLRAGNVMLIFMALAVLSAFAFDEKKAG
jgi:hypothetical protein